MKLPAQPLFSDSDIARETRCGELAPLEIHGRYTAHGVGPGQRRTQAQAGLRARVKRLWQRLTQGSTHDSTQGLP